ncbi:MAG: tRNA pseudouridine(55) synthase TruB [Candidatus Paceibacterota bacterium]|jgi:tRNA pseudouridine55 synthase
MKGIVVIDKPKDWTSFDVVDFLKKRLREKTIGHGGTLDPLATGVLIIAIGRNSTSILNTILKNSKKEYIAEILLGSESDTYDITGNITKNNIQRFPELQEIKNALDSFIGKIQQIPPKYSAVKISGVPAYRLAREGKEFELQPKEVELFEYKILNYSAPVLKIWLSVGSGFYVRSLANDLGDLLNTGGLLSSLIRSKVGIFTINEAIDLKTIQDDDLEVYFKGQGLVQGIGFRNYARFWAKRLNISGKAKNIENNFIEIIGQGKIKNLQRFLDRIQNGPPMANVKKQFYYFRKIQIPYSDFKKN